MKRTWTQVAGIHDFVLKESGPGFDEVGVAFALELFGYRFDRVIDMVVAEHQKADGREDPVLSEKAADVTWLPLEPCMCSS